MRILFIGDIVGNAGLQAIELFVPQLLETYKPDVTIANAENSASNGRGITRKVAESLFDKGIDFLTMGNHVWDNREIFQFLDHERRIIRPANYPGNAPGIGYTTCRVNNITIAIVNLLGRVFMSDYDSPFLTMDRILQELGPQVHHIFVDFHAETTSEKMAFAWYVAGKVSAVIGTHTHVQTADERILEGGTAYLSDVGMTGAYDGIIGMKKQPILQKFLTQMPTRFEVENGRLQLHAVCIDIDANGKSTHIERIQCLPKP
jgi:2',3'-cyclic-nucleotide 2'-phosphodiesterase